MFTPWLKLVIAVKPRVKMPQVLFFILPVATKMALDAIQLLGGNGYINEYPTGRLLRDAKLYEIGAGTSEIREADRTRIIQRISHKFIDRRIALTENMFLKNALRRQSIVEPFVSSDKQPYSIKN